MSLIAELQRRKVFKVGAAYLVVAWLAVQAASIAFPAFDAPPWALRIFILAALLGFPVVLVLTWVVDLTPDGVRLDGNVSGNKRVFAVAAILIVLALGWYFYGQPAFRKGETSPTTAAVAPPTPKPSVDSHSIAVLPFVNMSDDKENEYFSEGIAEELLNQLAQNPDLKVAARTSAFQFKGKDLDIGDIGRRLNVSHVLEGSVRKEGMRLRITAQLIDTASGFHLWSETFERSATDVFKVQDEISAAIAKALEARIIGGDASRPAQPSNPEAYDAYLMGRSLLARRVGDSLLLAIKAFDRAIAKDPQFSPAFSGRAFAYAIAPGWTGKLDFASSFNKALVDANHALQLDPENAEAYMVRGTVHSILFQEVAARTDLDHALALAPGNADILNFAGDDYQYVGNLRAAEQMKRKAMALDPLAFVHPSNLASILNAQGRFGEAIVQGQRGVELGGEGFSRMQIFWAQLRLRQLPAAAETGEAVCTQIGNDQAQCLIIRLALAAASGDKKAVERLGNQLVAKRAEWLGQIVFPSDVAAVYANDVGDIGKATLAMHDSLFGSHDYNTTIALLLGPNGARLPEEVSRDPEWLAIWNDPKLQETMAAYRANILAFRQGK
jgi:TolB-like protein/Tfp pilus assembly protein PilF